MAASEASKTPATTPNSVDLHALVDSLAARSDRGDKPIGMGRDRFPIFADDPLVEAHKKLNSYLNQVAGSQSWRAKAREFPAGVSLLGGSKEEMASAFRAILVRILFYARVEKGRNRPTGLLDLRIFNMLASFARSQGGNAEAQPMSPDNFGSLAGELLRKDIRISENDLVFCLKITSEQKADSYGFQCLSNEGVLRAVELHIDRHGLSPVLQAALTQWRENLQASEQVFTAGRKLVTRLSCLLDLQVAIPIASGEAWSNVALDDLDKMAAETKAKWGRLLQHCELAESSKPTQKWLKSARECVEDVDVMNLKSLSSDGLIWFRSRARFTASQPTPTRRILISSSAIPTPWF